MDDLSVERYLEVLKKDRCPLCFLMASSGLERLKSFLNEYVNDPEVRGTIAKAGGFCRLHAWQSVASGNNPVGVGLVHHSLLTEGLARIAKEKGDRPLFGPRKEKTLCLMCDWEASVADNLSRQFATCWAASPKLREEFDKNGILCVPHLEKVVRCSPPGERASIIEAGRKSLEGLLKELEEYLNKQDYRRAHEKSGEEWDSWIRAVRMMVGEKGTV